MAEAVGVGPTQSWFRVNRATVTLRPDIKKRRHNKYDAFLIAEEIRPNKMRQTQLAPTLSGGVSSLIVFWMPIICIIPPIRHIAVFLKLSDV